MVYRGLGNCESIHDFDFRKIYFLCIKEPFTKCICINIRIRNANTKMYNKLNIVRSLYINRCTSMTLRLHNVCISPHIIMKNILKKLYHLVSRARKM